MPRHEILAGVRRQRRALTLIGSLGSIVVAASTMSHADDLDKQQRAIDLITTTADRICNVVASRGEAQSSEVKGAVQAQLGGLASKLASLNISGSGGINSAEYRNVLQKDLAVTLKDNAVYKLKVFDTLQNKLLTSSEQSPSAVSLAQGTSPNLPSTFGFDVPCRDIEPTNNVQTILHRFGEQALSKAPVALIASSDRPVIVRPTVGGDDHLGAISVNTRVRVICMEDSNFAVIKEEKGGHDGVVEARDLDNLH
jgi:hypothetical protein